MKPPLDQSLKERFFAAYWGQEVAVQNEGGGSGFMYQITAETIDDIGRDYLLLRDISQLTDSEAIEVAKMAYPDSGTLYHTAELGRRLIRVDLSKPDQYISGVNWMQVFDYLRSIGIALPFAGYSVSELIEAGFVRIKEGGENA